jgi:putative hemolysin
MYDFEPITYSNKGSAWTRALVSTLEYLTGRLWIEYNYDQCIKKHDIDIAKNPDHPIFTTALDHMKIKIEIASGALENIPATGSLIVVANHPFGIVDGFIMNQLLFQRRKDFYILTNQVLLKSDRITPFLLPIDDSETPEAVDTNKKTIFKSLKHLKGGGTIGIFPAGRLARPKGLFKPFEDLDWQALLSYLITKSDNKETGQHPTILPLFFEGENSFLFRLAAMAKMFTLTRSLVLNECRNKAGKTIKVHIGQPITLNATQLQQSHLELANNLREKTLALGKQRQ